MAFQPIGKSIKISVSSIDLLMLQQFLNQFTEFSDLKHNTPIEWTFSSFEKRSI